MKQSPLAPKIITTLPALDGVRMATASAGIKYKNRTDLLLVVFDEPADVAGVFTRSRCPSAPVDHCRQSLGHGRARGIVVNSGNANAFTGQKGREATTLTAQAAADALQAQPNEIYLASTGVIGEPLDASKFTNLLGGLAKNAKPDQWFEAAKAIMTTDTFPKLVTRTIDFGGIPVTINGIAKGAGMIAPDMATMLSFVITDAPIDSSILQRMLICGVSKSFNSITIDSDTSTSDTLMLFATGAAQRRGAKRLVDYADNRFIAFSEALNSLLQELALQVTCDGEGARHLIRVNVIGAVSDQSAKKIAFSIANSPLVKTAVAGEDANWGRVVMAVGKAGEEADRDRLSIWFGEHRLAYNGERDPDYSEEATSSYMKGAEIVIRADIGLGNGEATVWTCDLTKEYVEINGDYRS